MCNITKVQQKYKGVRQIQRRPLISKKRQTDYPENYVHRKFAGYYLKRYGNGAEVHGEYVKYKLIYQ